MKSEQISNEYIYFYGQNSFWKVAVDGVYKY